MRQVILSILFLYVFDLSYAQGHFVVAWTDAGPSFMNIKVATATIGGVVLAAGDEIAAFDGAICCGKVILTEPILISNPGTYADIITSETDLGLSNGYTVGHTITYKIWDSSSNLEISGLTAQYFELSGNQITDPTYSPGGSAIVKLSNSVPVQLSVYLEGSIDTGTGLINTTLNTNALIPLGQPYNSAPWNYTGTETVTTIPATVVDWVLIELRQATSPALATSSTILAKRAAFLKSNGTIVDLNGTSTLSFNDYTLDAGKNLYAVIRHRNHLSIMSATGAILNTGTYVYNFTTGLSQAYGGANGYKQVGSKFAMVTGDIDQDGNIFVSDYNKWALGFGASNGYFNSDLDLGGSVFVPDYGRWAINFGSKDDNLLKSATSRSNYFSSVPK